MIFFMKFLIIFIKMGVLFLNTPNNFYKISVNRQIKSKVFYVLMTKKA